MPAITFANVAFGKSNADVKVYQTALKGKGYALVLDGKFGAKTKEATARFQHAQGWSGSDADGAPGKLTFARLGLTAKKKSGPAEPAHDYARIHYSGKTVNKRTKVMLDRACALLGVSSLPLSQGSYNVGVAASAGTHDGGGCIDVASSSWTTAKALRRVGFAAWVRTPAEGFSYHIHACAIGDRELASGARAQVHDYFNGRNGLANHHADSAPASVGRPYPLWAAKYK